MEARYLKIPSYKGMEFDAEGINLRFARTAVKIMTIRAALSLPPNLVLAACIESSTIKHKTAST